MLSTVCVDSKDKITVKGKYRKRAKSLIGDYKAQQGEKG